MNVYERVERKRKFRTLGIYLIPFLFFVMNWGNTVLGFIHIAQAVKPTWFSSIISTADLNTSYESFGQTLTSLFFCAVLWTIWNWVIGWKEGMRDREAVQFSELQHQNRALCVELLKIHDAARILTDSLRIIKDNKSLETLLLSLLAQSPKEKPSPKDTLDMFSEKNESVEPAKPAYFSRLRKPKF